MSEENIYQPPESNLEAHTDEVEYAGFWERVVASIIDTIILLVITSPILYAIYGEEYWSGETFSKGVWDFIISYIIPAVIVILFWVYKSATPGKMIMKLKVVNVNTLEPLTAPQAVGRYLGYYISTLFLCLGFIWVAFDKRKQGWHDKLANSTVIKAR